jgi:glutaryl-CoA dehydrogenase (non-decarboxylating)
MQNLHRVVLIDKGNTTNLGGRPVDFELTEEQRRIQQLARRFGQREIAPRQAQYDLEERFPMELYKEMGGLGMLGGTIPAEYGGAGMDYLSLTVMLEELGYFCLILPAVTGMLSTIVGNALLNYGTEEQIQRYLVPCCQGESLCAVGVTEPQGGTDVATVTTKATREGDKYILNGVKTWISYVGSADYFLTFAQMEGAKPRQGICAFILERGFSGFSTPKFDNKLGDRPGEAGELVFDDCVVPRKNLLGKEGEGLKIALSGLETNRLCFAARCCGAIRACLEESVEYARDRVVFGNPIGKYQLIQSKIVDMTLNLECTKSLIYKLAWLKDQGARRATKEASMAKLFATDALMKASTDAVQIFGAYGVSNDNKVTRIFRDAKVHQIMEGTSEIQTALIADYALGYRTN